MKTPTYELVSKPLTSHNEEFDDGLRSNMMGQGLMNVRENPDEENNPDAPPKKVKY
jgi:centrin-1